MSNEGDGKKQQPPKIPEGASSLMGMFQPPPGAPPPPAPAPAVPSADESLSETNAGSQSQESRSSTSRNAPLQHYSDLKQSGQNSEANKTREISENKKEKDSSEANERSTSPTKADPSLLNMFEHPKSPNRNPISPQNLPETPVTRPASKGYSNLQAMFDESQNQYNNIGSPLSIPEGSPISGEDRQTTVRLGNTTTEKTKLLKTLFDNEDKTPRVNKRPNYSATNMQDESSSAFQALLAPQLSSPTQQQQHSQQFSQYQTFSHKLKQFAKTHLQPTTFAGAFMFLLYDVVFCLANGSAIVRPSSQTPILGEMTKWTTVGILFVGPFYIYRLNDDVPAVYPSCDLFLAPFLASAAAVVDRSLAADGITSNSIFLASFSVLAAIGMLLSGLMLLAAARFKLANLGTFLPYSVLCGFFSAVGVLLWALSFSVDNNGHTWQKVFFSGDLHLIGTSLVHHIPSLVVGILMNLLGPKHPFYVILLIIITIIGFYTTMWITGTSLEEAQEQEWFWSRDELIIEPAGAGGSVLSAWVPPLPMGHIGAMLQGLVHWKAVYAGLSDMCALAFLYLLRSSIHSSAMKKNVNNLVCKTRVKKPTYVPRRRRSNARAAMSAFSERVGAAYHSLEGNNATSGVTTSVRRKPEIKKQDIPHLYIELATDVIDGNGDNNAPQGKSQEYEYIETRPKPCRRSLQGIFMEYGRGLCLVALSGGSGICPTVATSNTMYAIGAGGSAPQYGSILLLIIFYMTDFALVRYIPKACFSALLVLGAVDTFVVWFFLSFRKTQDILEWLVVPFIVLFSLVVGFLNAVFLGIGISTFVFVAAFFRVGVVKFNATALEIRSTIERSSAISDWLDNNGDLIQVICLQNYLMFMNASSILSYIETMFEDLDEDDLKEAPMYIPPRPKILILDMSLNTGMDTSTVDTFAEIKELCKNNGCKLFICGLSTRARKSLALAGVKPEPGLRDKRLVRFFPDLDTALGKAEDLITFELYHKDADIDPSDWRETVSSGSGFSIALQEIDEQHGIGFSAGLGDLEPYTVPIELKEGEHLFASDGGQVLDSERGLFFIESGMLKIERDVGNTLTRGRTASRTQGTYNTLNNLHARKGTVGREIGALRASVREPTTQTFRLARIGPGWVCGAIEGASGLKHAGVHKAVTKCRLHHISFDKLKALEDEDPKLILCLYKMLSHLMSRRQEITIGQLATFHSIMSAPAHSKPLSRAAIMALRR